MMRILNAEKVREEHRKKQRSKQQAEERGDFTQDVPQAESSKAAQARDSQVRGPFNDCILVSTLKKFARRKSYRSGKGSL